MSPTLSVTVCLGPNCSVLGGQELLGWCQDLCQAGLALSVETVLCTGHCAEAPVVLWQDRYVTEANPHQLTERLIREGWCV
ncbi:MAG: NAD(P)H-dependent oxidoreductase subunit E [Acidobacteria bacterium]|nr:NAD(P)H-dependent oxidoreductase subunit E [Acidobacteriota bacterium]MCB9398075.1 NAD(P)H-dependent oxidoreductase subunit E [Acidobacteriota bacterium]